MKPFALPLIPLLACAIAPCPPLPAADAAAEGATAQRLVVNQGRLKAEEGRAALLRFRQSNNANQQALVDAALAFKEAHELFSRAEDHDAVQDAQANLFWCKKQMNADGIQAFLKNKDAQAREAVVLATKMVVEEVPMAQAQAYYDRAERFAKERPNDQLQISIRWFEVAERFAGSPLAVKAQRQSLAAQDTWLKAIQAAHQRARETRFQRPRPVAEGARVAIPEPPAAKAAMAELRKAYAKAYARTAPASKRALAHRLLADAPKNRANAATYHAMLSEAVRLAQEGDGVETVLDASEALGDAFVAYDVAAEKRTALRRMPDRGVAAAVIALLDDPKDTAANATVGRFFCLTLGRWEDGLPMLALGNDEEAAKAAERELSKPDDPAEFTATADAWYDLGKKPGKSSDRHALWRRALSWYRKGQGALDGVERQRVDKRLAEIDRALPLDLDSMDWDTVTPTQWEKLKGKAVTVTMRLDRTDPLITLRAGDKVRLVPHPTDTWTFSDPTGQEATCGWQGKPRGKVRWSNSSSRLDLNEGLLLAWLDNGGSVPANGIIEGPGRLFFAANRNDQVMVAKGQIRVKVLPVKDEDD